MSDSRAAWILAAVMAVVAVIGVSITALLLYQAALEQESRRLQDLVAAKGELMEAVARYDAAAGPVPGYDTPQAATLAQVREAHRGYEGLGETGELTLARRGGGRIEFLLSLRHQGEHQPGAVPWEGRLAEPMRRALQGETGAMTGLDYRGQRVLAAYRPVGALEAGLVAKLDLAEVRRPFLLAVAAAGAALALLVAFGTILVLRITRHLEREGAASRRTVAALVANLPGAVYRRTSDPAAPMAFVSDAVEDLTGYPAADFMAGRVRLGSHVIHPEDRARVGQEIQAAVAAERPFQLAYRIRRADGAERHVGERGVAVRDHDVAGVVLEGYIEDVTREHEAEAALRDLNRTLRTVDACHAAVIRARDEDGLCVEMCRLLGEEGGYAAAWVALRGPADVPLRVCAQWGPGAVHAPAVLDQDRAAGNGGPAVRALVEEKPVVMGDLMLDPAYGPWRDEVEAHGLGSAVFLPLVSDGLGMGVLAIYGHAAGAFAAADLELLAGLAADLAFGLAARRHRAAVEESEGRLRSLVEGSADALLVVDGEGIVRFANAAAADLFGRSRAALAGSAFGLAATPGDYFTADVICGDGTVRRAEGRPREVTWGGRTGQLITLRDVTAREHEAAEQHRQRELLQNILDNIPALVAWKDAELTYVGANRAFAAASGHRHPEDVAGATDADMPWTAEERERGLGVDAEVVGTGGPVTGRDERLRLADGSTAELLTSRAPLLDMEGRVAGVLFIGLDISERREAERRLAQAQKMEAVGNLTGGVAHDFNNLLGVILGNLQLMERQVEKEPDADPLLVGRLEAAIGAVGRGADLTRRLLAFSRRQVLEPRVVDLNELVTGMEKILGRTLGETITIRFSRAADPWPVSVDPGQLESALLNLAINARDAMPGGGTLSIETANVTLDRAPSGGSGPEVPGHYVMVAVSDTGIGMAPEVRDKAFEPFFTTKEAGRGTGLGLSMVHGFVNQSQGVASIYSEEGCGTTVKLYFPRATGEAGEAAASQDGEGVPGGDETVLVVEDDAELRDTAAEFLGTLGYRVVEADTGPAALEALEAADGVDLLFTDMVMPGGMNGAELAGLARQRWPGLRVLVTSGYAREGLKGARLRELHAEFLSKPYRLEELGHAVRRMLDRS